MMLDAALEYAARGWPVFPVHYPVDGGCSCRKECGQIGKHPRTENGFKDATLDPDVIRSWWVRWPDANIGLRTGIAFDVLDIDGGAAGRALLILAELAGEDPEMVLADGPMAHTARGVHLYFMTTGASIAEKVFDLKGIDWRGAGGYVVAPPSLHASGVRYTWADTNPPDAPLEPAPIFIVAELLNLPAKAAPVRHGTSRGIIAGLVDHLARQTEGSRNAQLNWAAHTLGIHVYKGELNDDEGRRGCDELYDAAIRIGLTDHEAKATIKSGWQAGRQGVVRRTAS